jgi:hypothetical protein
MSNSPPEAGAISIIKIVLIFLLRNMDYYCSADTVLIESMKVHVFLYCFTVPPKRVVVAEPTNSHIRHNHTTNL